jgi:hypothetical protein
MCHSPTYPIKLVLTGKHHPGALVGTMIHEKMDQVVQSFVRCWATDAVPGLWVPSLQVGFVSASVMKMAIGRTYLLVLLVVYQQ